MVVEEIIIRELDESDSIEELTELLHRSYKILADMGLKYLATYQKADVTLDRIKDGICFVVEKDDKIIATITYYPPNESHASQKVGLDDTAWIGQMAVDPKFQKQGFGKKLIEHVEQYAKGQNIPRIALDTSEEATHLVELYEKLGYKFHSYVSWDITNYRSVVFIKSLT